VAKTHQPAPLRRLLPWKSRLVCVNLAAGYALADLPALRPGPKRRQAGYVNQPTCSGIDMKKLLAAVIAGLFAVSGAAIAADMKKEEKKAEAKKEEKKAEAKKEEKKDAKK